MYTMIAVIQPLFLLDEELLLVEPLYAVDGFDCVEFLVEVVDVVGLGIGRDDVEGLLTYVEIPN